LEQALLIFLGAPAAGDKEVHAVAPGIGRSPAQGGEQIGVEVGYTRNLIDEDRRSVRDGTVSLAEPTTGLTGKTVVPTWRSMVLTAKNVGW
jgi:hypothetical protein